MQYTITENKLKSQKYAVGDVFADELGIEYIIAHKLKDKYLLVQTHVRFDEPQYEYLLPSEITAFFQNPKTEFFPYWVVYQSTMPMIARTVYRYIEQSSRMPMPVYHASLLSRGTELRRHTYLKPPVVTPLNHG